MKRKAAHWLLVAMSLLSFTVLDDGSNDLVEREHYILTQGGDAQCPVN